MNMFWFSLLVFAFVFILVLAIWIPVWRKNSCAEDGVVNHDAMMTQFVWRVQLLPSEIIPALTKANVQDALRCSLDPDGQTLRMSLGHSEDACYHFTIEQHNGFSVLRLVQTPVILAHGMQKTMLNPFVIGKLGAEPLPYSDWS